MQPFRVPNLRKNKIFINANCFNSTALQLWICCTVPSSPKSHPCVGVGKGVEGMGWPSA